MKKLLLFKFIALSLFTLVSVAKLNAQVATDLFFSEYEEGSVNSRAFEIFNGTGADVDLSAYSVKQSHNGTGWGVDGISYVMPLTGTLASNDVYVISTSDASAGVLAVADLKVVYDKLVVGGTIPFYTGDDAMGLFKGDVLIDVIGIPSVDPGSGWDVAGIAIGTVDHTLVRKASIIVGTTDWAASAGTNADDSQWIVNAIDDIANLGLHTFGTTGISKLSASRSNIYPNPATSYFNVKAPEGDYRVSINNTVGSLVKSVDLNSTGKVEMSELRPGIYYVTVKNVNTNTKEVHKLIVR
ncbi:MAG: T9SS type A sorting domain-containing protein [Bacteroidales bacterium]|nr:T9SS type A sorting domain-containing protein [Bacteroidales bacterium]